MKAKPDLNALAELLDIMARLRDRNEGCPWDLEQSFATIAPYTIEEAYEVADAIERSDLGDLKDELGDLLFQVVFHARMAEETGAFADFIRGFFSWGAAAAARGLAVAVVGWRAGVWGKPGGRRPGGE